MSTTATLLFTASGLTSVTSDAVTIDGGGGDPASIQLIPSSFSVFEGATYTDIVAIIRDASGNILALDPTSYEFVTPNAAVATINSSTGAVTGVVGGAAAGPTIQVRARYAPFSLVSPAITATVAVPSSGHPNEPAGMTPIFTHDGTSVEMGGAWIENARQNSTATIVRGRLAIGTDPKKLQTTQVMTVRLVHVDSDVPPTNGIAFSAAHAVTANKFGAVLVQYNPTTFAFSTKVVATPQAYDTSTDAINNLPAADAGNVWCGYVQIKAGGSGWTATVDDLTFGGDQVEYFDSGNPDPYAIPRDILGFVRTVHDASFPGVATDVLELSMYPLTTPPGGGQGRVDTRESPVTTFGATKVYVAGWQKISAGFMGNAPLLDGGPPTSGSLKNVILKFQQQYSSFAGFHVCSMKNNGLIAAATTRIRPAISLTGLPGIIEHDGITMALNVVDYCYPDEGQSGDPGDLLSRGNWHFVEALVSLNSVDTDHVTPLNDGEVQYWIDGFTMEPVSITATQVSGMHGTGIKWAYGGLRLTFCEWSNAWGGNGQSIQALDHTNRIGDLYISGGFARAGERPDRWNITAVGGVTTIARSATVELIAQLLDENSNPVRLFYPQPRIVTYNGSPRGTYVYTGSDAQGSFAARGAISSGPPDFQLPEVEEGRFLFNLTADPAATIGGALTFAVEDWAIINSGGALVDGDHHTSNVLSLTVTA